MAKQAASGWGDFKKNGGVMDKWLMFKNYMHNELGITKEDIQQWIKDSSEDIARRMVENEFSKFNVNSIVDKYVMDRNYWGSEKIKKEIVDRISSEAVKQVEITVKNKKQ